MTMMCCRGCARPYGAPHSFWCLLRKEGPPRWTSVGRVDYLVMLYQCTPGPFADSHVHHKDGDPRNNDLANLELVRPGKAKP
jgi:hypothetical protein